MKSLRLLRLYLYLVNIFRLPRNDHTCLHRSVHLQRFQSLTDWLDSSRTTYWGWW